MLDHPEEMVHCSIWYLTAQKATLIQVTFHSTAWLHQDLVPVKLCLLSCAEQRPSPFLESCTKTLRNESNENLTAAFLEEGAQAEASLDNPPSVLNAITAILSFPNFICICIWVNKLANLRHYFLMASEPFLQTGRVLWLPVWPK